VKYQGNPPEEGGDTVLNGSGTRSEKKSVLREDGVWDKNFAKHNAFKCKKVRRRVKCEGVTNGGGKGAGPGTES